jgi:hypothetical protein
MSYLKFITSLIAIFCCTVQPLKGVEQQNRFKILKQNNNWSLYHNDKPFYIKGAVGWHDYKLLKTCGANSVRLQASRRQLDRAWEEGLYAMAGLPVRGERNGMDWDDQEMVEAQKQKVLNLVTELKNHPAVMCWAIGNELDWIPPGRPCNPNLWIRLNDIAQAIHALDPDHPVLTVVGTGQFEQKIKHIALDCSDMDLLGINTYSDIQEVINLADTHWPKSYVIAEWGPTGHWQVPKTLWNAPIEQTSSEKAQVYYHRYFNVISKHKSNCLGSYVFLWGEKQETTHSWYGMFRDGLMTESVDVMKYAWSGTWPGNRAPIVLDIHIEDFDDKKNVILKPQKNYRAYVICYDVDHDTLIYDWDIRPEVEIPENSYAGGMEKPTKIIPGLISNGGGPQISFTTPKLKGPYRLFVQIADGQNNAGYGNIPFYLC